IDQTYTPPLNDIEAWKVFIRYADEHDLLRFPYCSIDGTLLHASHIDQAIVPGDEWLAATPRIAKTLRGEEYATGFHAFLTRSQAIEYSRRRHAVVVPVVLRGVRLRARHAREGMHQEEPKLQCWIADRMRIVK